MQHGQIDQHMHLRRRAHRANSVRYAYPSSNRFIRTIDRIIYAVGVLGPLVSIPQIIEIYEQGNAQGVSASTWIGYSVLGIFWLMYGLVHREKPIILSQSLWLIVNVAISIGAILY